MIAMFTGVYPSLVKFSRANQNMQNQKLKLVRKAPMKHGTQSKLMMIQIIGFVLYDTDSYLSAIRPAIIFENTPPRIIAHPLTSPNNASFSKN